MYVRAVNMHTRAFTSSGYKCNKANSKMKLSLLGHTSRNGVVVHVRINAVLSLVHIIVLLRLNVTGHFREDKFVVPRHVTLLLQVGNYRHCIILIIREMPVAFLLR